MEESLQDQEIKTSFLALTLFNVQPTPSFVLSLLCSPVHLPYLGPPPPPATHPLVCDGEAQPCPNHPASLHLMDDPGALSLSHLHVILLSCSVGKGSGPEEAPGPCC